jgi:hypothetical protein
MYKTETSSPVMPKPRMRTSSLLFQTPYTAADLAAATRNMEAGLCYMLRNNDYNFNYINIYLADVIFRMADVTLTCSVDFTTSFVRPALVCYLALSVSEAGRIIVLLNQKMPGIKAGFASTSDADTLPQYPAAIAIDMDYLSQHLIPKMPQFFLQNPARVSCYNDSINIVNGFNGVFEQMHISAYKVDIFEDTLCQLAGVFAQSKGLELPAFLSTTSSLFVNENVSADKTAIYLTTPLLAAKHIVDYLNSIEANSATLAPEQQYCLQKKELLTKITVKNTVLLSDRLKADLSAALQSYPREKIEAYQRQSGYEAKSSFSP